MEISATDHANVIVMTLKGSLDSATAGGALETISGALQQAVTQKKHDGNIVLDLSAVAFMSSAGLRTILISTQEARALGGDLRLAAATSNVYRVLDVSGFNKIIRYFAVVDDAVASFQD
jgi:anti-anti-sigma factor